MLEGALRSLKEALDLPDGLRHTAIANGFLELVPTYTPSPSGLGRALAQPAPALGQPQLTAPSSKIIVLRPSVPLAQAQS